MVGVSTIFLVMAMALILISTPCTAQSGWTPSNATFYIGPGTTAGACGYEDTVKEGHGLATTALSTALFNNGRTCGACYEIKCFNSTQWCKPGTIQVTATKLCPPRSHPGGGNWCKQPQKHFDLTEPMFLRISEYKAGIVPVLYHRVPCQGQGGIKFELKGNPNWLLVLVFNVTGDGDVTSVKIKGSRTGWIQMTETGDRTGKLPENLWDKACHFK